jgi:hypothetical protein
VFVANSGLSLAFKMSRGDMYDYILSVPQPTLIVQAPKPAEPPKSKMTDREKAQKEERELRKWWDNLSEEKKSELRKKQFTYPPKCYCAKKVIVTCKCSEPKKEPAEKP